MKEEKAAPPPAAKKAAEHPAEDGHEDIDIDDI